MWYVYYYSNIIDSRAIVLFKIKCNRHISPKMTAKVQIIWYDIEDEHFYDKVEFYKVLNGVYCKIPKYDRKIILGEANSRIGKEAHTHNSRQ